MDLAPELFQQKCMEILYMLKLLLDETDRTKEHEISLIFPVSRHGFSAEELIVWTMEQANRILNSADSDREKTGIIQVVKEYINRHFQEGITLDAIAEQVRMSPTYLSMLFKREEGVTYIRYLTKIRMEKAAEYMRQGYRARQACEMVGYFDYKHFSAQFKTFTGMTPDAYRRKSGGE